ncbi:hypothetical protein [Pyrobaculum ferrireducens]|uniref:Uncharacterized protein n=1 Tax=Pyrobaculum ferrireducens TaxID=1104324 RepID=G7VBK8_9CREN|nr:hypothetical protein [Pyrobaculum ferrireducens]AET32438.1 hypothetical protein P186_0999 [Pyrobaculum ferrireducens]
MERLHLYIQHCVDERCVRDELAALVRGRREVEVLAHGITVRADVAAGSEAYEVKLDAEPHDGVGQALVLKAAGLRPHLVHVLRERADLFEKYVQLLKALRLDICIHVVAVDGRYASLCPP